MLLCGVRNHIVCILSYQFCPSDGRAFCLDLESSSWLLCALPLGSSDTLALGNVVVFGVPLVLVVVDFVVVHLVVHLVVVHLVVVVVDHLVVHLVVVHLIVHLVVVHHVIHLVVVHHVVHLVVVHLVNHLVAVHLVVVVYNGTCSFLGSSRLGWYSVSSAGSVYTDFIHILSLLLFQFFYCYCTFPLPLPVCCRKQG